MDQQEIQLRVVEWEHLDLWKFYPLAMASSWSVRCLLYPMTVVRSRLQLQKQNSVYRGMRHAFIDIFRKEGVTALYRGFWITIPQLGTALIYSSIYERVRHLVQVHAGITKAPLISALAGCSASAFNQTIFVPTDIIAQHMMTYNKPAEFAGASKNSAVVDAMRADGMANRRTLGLRVISAVYRVDGVRGFYRGFLSSLMLYLPSNMVFWSSYCVILEQLRLLRWKLISSNNEDQSKPKKYRNLFVDQAIAGAMGGVVAAVCTNPLEVLRIRIQVHRTTYRETLRELIKTERSRVFTKGLAPRVISNGVYSCLIMLGYETVKKVCVLPQYRDSVIW